MSGYIGNIPVPQATQTRQTFDCTAGQTTFNTAGYAVGYLDVFMNGIKLVDGEDFTATNGSDVVLTTGAALNDIVDIVLYTAAELTVAAGGGLFKGNRGTAGPAAQAGDIFRVNEQTLNENVTIDATENAAATGPLTIASGVTLTVKGNLTVV